MLSWTFAELEAALAQSHLISDASRTAFQARLKNLHRLEFPPRFVAVKGKATRYSGTQICQMALAVELAQLGVPPDRAISIYEAHEGKILTAFEQAIQTVLADDDFPLLLIFDPNGLANLQSKHFPDGAILTFEVLPIGRLHEKFLDWSNGHFPRAAIINLTRMIGELAGRLAAIGDIEKGSVREAILESVRENLKERHGNP